LTKQREYSRKIWSGERFSDPSKIKCYLAEARATLEDKHWEGKNKCTKLPGDEEE